MKYLKNYKIFENTDNIKEDLKDIFLELTDEDRLEVYVTRDLLGDYKVIIRYKFKFKHNPEPRPRVVLNENDISIIERSIDYMKMNSYLRGFASAYAEFQNDIEEEYEHGDDRISFEDLQDVDLFFEYIIITFYKVDIPNDEDLTPSMRKLIQDNKDFYEKEKANKIANDNKEREELRKRREFLGL